MPAKKARMMSNAECRAFIDALKQFKKDGTGVDDELIRQFPIFHGKAPPGHPYPDAFTGIDPARDAAEKMFRRVYGKTLSGIALELRVRERMLDWDENHDSGLGLIR